MFENGIIKTSNECYRRFAVIEKAIRVNTSSYPAVCWR